VIPARANFSRYSVETWDVSLTWTENEQPVDMTGWTGILMVNGASYDVTLTAEGGISWHVYALQEGCWAYSLVLTDLEGVKQTLFKGFLEVEYVPTN
jgi:hypothetical protein